MTTIIPRIYDTYGNALDAVTELKKSGYRSDEIALISRAPNREPGDDTDPATAIARTGIPKEDVGAFADTVQQGKSLLIVRAVWGAAAKAIGIVDRHAPAVAAVGRREYSTAQLAGERAKFSMTFGWPLLINDATPFSNFWKWPVLWSNATPFSTMFSWPTLHSGYTFGSPKLLTNRGAIFSDELKIPVLLERPPSSK